MKNKTANETINTNEVAKRLEYYKEVHIKQEFVPEKITSDLEDLFNALVSKGLQIFPVGDIPHSGDHFSTIDVAIISHVDSDAKVYLNRVRLLPYKGKKGVEYKVVELDTMFIDPVEGDVSCKFRIQTSCVNCAESFYNFICKGKWPDGSTAYTTRVDFVD